MTPREEDVRTCTVTEMELIPLQLSAYLQAMHKPLPMVYQAHIGAAPVVQRHLGTSHVRKLNFYVLKRCNTALAYLYISSA